MAPNSTGVRVRSREQNHLTEIKVTARLPADHVQVNALVMKLLQRRRHVVLVHQQSAIRLGHLVAREPASISGNARFDSA